MPTVHCCSVLCCIETVRTNTKQYNRRGHSQLREMRTGNHTTMANQEMVIPTNPRDVDLAKLLPHQRELTWKNWANYQEKLAKERDSIIREKELIFSMYTGIANQIEDELQHYKDMLYHLLHKPYLPKQKGSKWNMKNKVKNNYLFSVINVC